MTPFLPRITVPDDIDRSVVIRGLLSVMSDCLDNAAAATNEHNPDRAAGAMHEFQHARDLCVLLQSEQFYGRISTSRENSADTVTTIEG